MLCVYMCVLCVYMCVCVGMGGGVCMCVCVSHHSLVVGTSACYSKGWGSTPGDATLMLLLFP